jgi:hypothetical protein
MTTKHPMPPITKRLREIADRISVARDERKIQEQLAMANGVFWEAARAGASADDIYFTRVVSMAQDNARALALLLFSEWLPVSFPQFSQRPGYGPETKLPVERRWYSDMLRAIADHWTPAVNGVRAPGRRGRMRKDDSEASRAAMLAYLVKHPSMKDDIAGLAIEAGVSPKQARRWRDEWAKAEKQRTDEQPDE